MEIQILHTLPISTLKSLILPHTLPRSIINRTGFFLLIFLNLRLFYLFLRLLKIDRLLAFCLKFRQLRNIILTVLFLLNYRSIILLLRLLLIGFHIYKICVLIRVIFTSFMTPILPFFLYTRYHRFLLIIIVCFIRTL